MPTTIQAKPHDHVVQFYQDDTRLTKVVADYFRAGADAGERLVALLTPPHRESLLEQLAADGVDTSSLIAEGQLVILDARAMLDRIMRNGVPVHSLFRQQLLTHIETSPSQPVRAFGELVNLLCDGGNPAAAVQLEAFWHKACERLPLTLLCGYDLYAFHQEGGQQAFAAICSHHSHVLPAEASFPTTDKHRTKGIPPLCQQPDGGQPKTELQAQDKRAQDTCDQILAQLTAPASAERETLYSALEGALSRGEMVLHFRPVVCAQTRQVVGVSVVPHWHSDSFGIMAPNRWMEAARETGQSAAISRWLLAGACRQAMGWYVVPGSGLRMTVPISASDLISTDLIARVDEALAVSGLPGEMLELEVSEDSLTGFPRQTENAVRLLKARGVRLAVAGVASASSILQHFSHYPMDTLRISGTIIDGCLDNRHHQTTIESMIVMAHQLGLSVTADNVSTREQVSYLQELGCDTLQGRLWASMEYCEPKLETAARAASDADLFSGMDSTESPVTNWKEGHDLLSAIMDTTLDGLGVLESIRNEGGTITDFHIRKCNHRMCEIVENSASNLIGKHLLDIHPGTKEEGIFQAYCAVVETGTPLQMETHYLHEGMDLSLRITAVRLGDGVLVTMTDISAFKH
ncbi:EAL domain-containing protein [Marinobacter changyiensis]|uniref:EAL domain-containing protein n=1 Tax=Marinobacter changyiensis TaxID=2604091 RepID=UPI001264AA70|nr:EAL domain-containing protein [Marinobacter changyiensis]